MAVQDAFAAPRRGRHETSHVATDANGNSTVQSLSFGQWLPALFAGGIFVSYWVLYTFENGGTLGEETKDASRNAPRAIIGAFLFAAACGVLFLGGFTTSLKDPAASMLSGSPTEDAIGLHLPGWVTKLFLAAVVEGLLLATSTMFAGATRHIFGMSRDNQLPFSHVWTRTTKDGAPWAASILVAVLGLTPVFIFTTNTASIVGGATAAMYVSYFLVTAVVLWTLLRGWPHKRAHFNLGRWNIPVTLIAMAGTGLTTLNLLWPRATTNPNFDQISGEVTDSVSRHIPMGWYIVGVPILIGIVYYVFRQRKIEAALDQAAMVPGQAELVAD